MRKLILVSICFLSMSQFARAALFDDKEARQQIQDLQQKTDAQNQATQAAIESIKKSIAEIEGKTNTNNQALLDLLSQIETLNQALSQMKGELEVAQHFLEVSQERQKELYADTDGRLRKLETPTAPVQSADPAQPVKNNEVTPPAEKSSSSTQSSNEAAIDGAESKAYDAAQGLLKAGKYKEAFEAFDKFIQNYSSSKELPNAQYSLGYAQFSLKNYRAAIATQQKLIAQFPDSPKVPDAKFNVANCQIQLSDIEAAKKTLKDLIAQHPTSELIPNAKRRLTILESIKK
jgi:tol-pal system protein YbgF